MLTRPDTSYKSNFPATRPRLNYSNPIHCPRINDFDHVMFQCSRTIPFSAAWDEHLPVQHRVSRVSVSTFPEGRWADSSHRRSCEHRATLMPTYRG